MDKRRLEKHLHQLDYVQKALEILAHATSPDNGVGYIDQDIVHVNVWNLARMTYDILEGVKKEVYNHE